MTTRQPVKIINLDTEEEYFSIRDAARKLGYLSNLPIPKEVRENGGEFKAGGYRLHIEV
jgi:hypothetical protein